MDPVQQNTKVLEPSVSEDNTTNNIKGDDSSAETKIAENPGKSNPKYDARSPQVGLKKTKKGQDHPPTSEMVLESIKSLKMRKGAPFEAIREYIEGHYEVGAKSIKPLIKRFLKTGVEKGILECVSGEGPDGRFKIKKPEAPKKDKQNPKQKNQKKTVVQKGNLQVRKKGRPPGKIEIKKSEMVKKNENLKLNQATPKTVNN